MRSAIFGRAVQKSDGVARLVQIGDEANHRHSWREAEKAYHAALVLDASLKHIWVQYGHSLKEQGHFVAAEEAYRRSLKLDAAIADTHLQLGHVLKLQEKLDEAVDAYLNAYRLQPTHQDAARELRELDVVMPTRADHVDEFTCDPDFVDSVYGIGERPGDAFANAHAVVHADKMRYVSREHLLAVHGLCCRILNFLIFAITFMQIPSFRQRSANPTGTAV
jgi:tetratricopeptide (TPR) repeat protein